jgi:tetratricopeptide (TPR) repeat protein
MEQESCGEPHGTRRVVRASLVLVLAVMTGARMNAEIAPERDVQGALAEGARLEQAGDATGALESYLWAVQAARQQSPERGRALLSLANVEAGLGRYADSTRHAADAATVFEVVGDGAGVASALNRGGVTALAAGDYPEAERLLTLAVARSTAIGDQDRRAEQLGNLANVHFFVGRYADAARLNQEALTVTAAAAAEPWAGRRRRILLSNQATLLLRLGRYQEALAVFDQLGAMSGDLRPRERAEILVNLGVLYRRLGDPIKALSTYDEARALFARDRAVDGEINVLKNRGIVLALDLLRLDEAERTFSVALETATASGNKREMLHARLYRGETRLRAGRADQSREDYAAGLAIARDLRTPEEEWKALYGLGRVEPDAQRAVEYLDEAVRTIEQVREGIRVQSMRSDFLTDKRVVYDALIKARLPDASAGVLFGLLERSHSRVWRERLGLAKSIDLISVQRAMPAGGLLLDYWHSAQGSAVIAVSRDKAAVIRLDIDDRQVAALIDLLSAGPSSNWRDLSRDLGARLLPPSPWFEGIDRVQIVADGALALVPFDVLPIDGRLLIERAAVSYTPTAATLMRRFSGRGGFLPPWRLQLRVFADPRFASADLDDVDRLDGRLDASADEARRVAGELAGRAALHLGPENRKASLLAANERAPMLHLATHAVADASALERSRIVFSPAAGAAGADYLFLKEAYGLPLDGVELAVLSACETERGRFVGGEGVESFSRAFLAAGARTTVTTLWRVSDRPTANFMQVFYHHLQRGVARDEALRRAKLRFLESGTDLADPHFWAAFVLSGEALRPVPRAISRTAVALTTLPIVALLWFLVRRVAGRRRPRAKAAV